MENVAPAIGKTNEKTLKELSGQEFQQMLSSWFEEKGIVQEMRSYLKFQMINVLKNTAVGKNIKKGTFHTYTLAQQALHLIVAEYLLHHHCNFALSLFSTEVNLSNILPETKLFSDTENVSRKATRKFDKENLVNILELIGLQKGSQYFIQVLDEYFDKPANPLLSCLLSIIRKDIIKTPNKEDSNIDMEFEDDFMKNVYLMLRPLNLSQKVYKQLFYNLKVCYELKTKSYESQVVVLVNKFKKELNSRQQTLHHCQKRKKHLQKKLIKLTEENEILKEKILAFRNEEKLVKSEKVIEKVVSLSCSLCHCNEECINNRALCETYRKEIENFKSINDKQKEEIERLNLKCDELLREFNSCQTKINLVNLRLQEDIVEELQPDYGEKALENISSRSDSLTEEILQRARQKLRLLEEESEELDLRFSNFVIK